MPNDSKLIVVGASDEELLQLQRCLPDWECVEVAINDKETVVAAIPSEAKVAVVYAQREQDSTLAICDQLRNPPESSALPILLVVGRYDITQGHAVSEKGNATFIICPFEEMPLRDTTDELLMNRL